MFRIQLVVALLLAVIPQVAHPEAFSAGGDLYVAGEDSRVMSTAGRDLFATGFSVRLTAPVTQDAHLLGARVEVARPVGGDLMAAGGDVKISAPVQGDLSVAGVSVTTDSAARIGGNARLSGGAVTIGGPVEGALVVSAGEVTLDAPIGGDVWLTAGTLRFGAEARIAGRLHYSTREPLAIPAAVIAEDRVTFHPLGEAAARMVERDWNGHWPLPGRGAVLAGAATTLVFFVAMGAIFLAFAPRMVADLDGRIAARPAIMLLRGLIALSAAIGLVPILALTIIGLPLLPVILLAIILLWMVGYLLGVFAVSLRVLRALRGGAAEPGMGLKLAALAAGLVVAALLNFIPVLGWMANFLLVLLGIGAIASLPFERPAPAMAGGGEPGAPSDER